MPKDLKRYEPALMAGASIGVNATLTDILDENENEVVEILGVASAVNYLRLQNSAAGSDISLEAQGTDTNVGIDIKPKGTGGVQLFTGTATTGILLDIESAALTTGQGINLNDADLVTTGTLVNVVSNSSNAGNRALVTIRNVNTAAGSTTSLWIYHGNDAHTAAVRIQRPVLVSGSAIGIDFTGFGTQEALFMVPQSGGPMAMGTSTHAGFFRIKVGGPGTDMWVPFYRSSA